MALKRCPDCGQNVSNLTTSCPDCGSSNNKTAAPKRSLKGWAWLFMNIFGIVLLVVLMALV